MSELQAIYDRAKLLDKFNVDQVQIDRLVNELKSIQDSKQLPHADRILALEVTAAAALDVTVKLAQLSMQHQKLLQSVLDVVRVLAERVEALEHR